MLVIEKNHVPLSSLLGKGICVIGLQSFAFLLFEHVFWDRCHYSYTPLLREDTRLNTYIINVGALQCKTLSVVSTVP